MQPLTIFYPLKDSKNLFFKKPCFFICNLFIPFRSTSFVFLFFLFFVFPGTLNFQCLVVVNFIFYCVILYVNIFIYKKENKRKSKGLSNEKINSIKTPNHSITIDLNYYGTKARVEFNGSCLKQESVTFNHGKH